MEVEPISVLILVSEASEALALDLNWDAMLLPFVEFPAF
jgi:hypothetical protein